MSPCEIDTSEHFSIHAFPDAVNVIGDNGN